MEYGFRGDGEYSQARFPDTYRVPITHRWSGGEQPVVDDTVVLVQFRNNYEPAIRLADLFSWNHYGEDDDIIGFTVLDVIGVEDES